MVLFFVIRTFVADELLSSIAMLCNLCILAAVSSVYHDRDLLADEGAADPGVITRHVYY